jgi:hypothetical protein
MLAEQTQFSVMFEEENEVTTVLEEETRFFTDNFEKLLDRYVGKLVLIKGSRLVGVFETQRAAFKEGARMFGLGHFLIRRVGLDSRLCVGVPLGSSFPDACACARCSGTYFTTGSLQAYA